MKNPTKKKLAKKLPRNPHALNARQRKAGPMKDRRTPRGGAKGSCCEDDYPATSGCARHVDWRG